MVKQNDKNFNWNSFINDKAIVAFEKENNLEGLKLGLNSYYLLSYFINLYTNPKKGKNIIYRYINNTKYIYVSSSFILNNLKLLKIKKRSLVRLLNALEEYGYINKTIEYGSQRFIKISDKLLSHCDPNFIQNSNTQFIDALSQKVGLRFAKTNKNQLNDVKIFLNKQNDLEYFENQFDAYIKFKTYSNELLHRFDKYCEIWDGQDWNLLLKQLKHIHYQDQINNLH